MLGRSAALVDQGTDLPLSARADEPVVPPAYRVSIPHRRSVSDRLVRVALHLLEGVRLRLKPAAADHIDFFTELNGDPTVMEHITGEPMSRSQTESEWTRRLAARSATDRGLGYWTGYLDGEPVGWWGLGFQASQPDAGELGFRLKRRHWRQGLGLEGGRLLVEHGFGTVGVTRIWAGTVERNAASRATLSRLGLRCTDEPVPGVLTYEITYEQWLERPDAHARMARPSGH